MERKELLEYISICLVYVRFGSSQLSSPSTKVSWHDEEYELMYIVAKKERRPEATESQMVRMAYSE